MNIDVRFHLFFNKDKDKSDIIIFIDMISQTSFVNDVENGLTYRLQLDFCESHGRFRWDHYLSSLPINEAEEKKNKNFFEWNDVFGTFPKSCEIMFSKMKDDIIDQVNKTYNSDFRDYRTNLFD